jgi:hypothetical protein
MEIFLIIGIIVALVAFIAIGAKQSRKNDPNKAKK